MIELIIIVMIILYITWLYGNHGINYTYKRNKPPTSPPKGRPPEPPA
jgi:hypothetical protein